MIMPGGDKNASQVQWVQYRLNRRCRGSSLDTNEKNLLKRHLISDSRGTESLQCIRRVDEVSTRIPDQIL